MTIEIYRAPIAWVQHHVLASFVQGTVVKQNWSNLNVIRDDRYMYPPKMNSINLIKRKKIESLRQV